MKVYTRVVLDWDGNVLEEESYEYDGPVAQAGGGSGSTTSTTVQKADPWAGVQPYLKGAYADAASLYKAGGPQYYPGQTFAGRDPLEDEAQTMALSIARNRMPGQVGQMGAALGQALDAPNVAYNPYVGGMADVIAKRMGRQFTEQINPAIRTGAVAAGGLGGSRQALAQGLGIRGVSEATGDALANLYGDAYGRGLEQQARGLALAPTTIQAGMLPAQAVGDVGAYRRGEQEMALQADIDRWNYLQQAPYSNLSNYMGLLQGAPWGSTSTGTAPAQRSNPVTGALGGAMLGNMLFPGVGGLIGGGLLGGLFS